MLQDFIHTIKNYTDLIKVESSNSWTNVNKSQNEPEIIFDYLTQPNQGVDYLNSKIASKITTETKYEMKFASIYCHQKPRIQRTFENIEKCDGDNKTEKCELGDLVIHFLLLDKDKKVQFSNAIILQAKVGNKPDNRTQQCLYENDDCLIFPKYFGEENEICKLPKYEDNRAKALAYLFISDDISVGQIPIANKLVFSWSFIIQRLLTNDFGKAYSYSEKTYRTDWDKLISKLIFNLSKSKPVKGKKRVNGLDFVLNKFNYYYYYPEYKLTLDYEGIPTIMIIVRNTE